MARVRLRKTHFLILVRKFEFPLKMCFMNPITVLRVKIIYDNTFLMAITGKYSYKLLKSQRIYSCFFLFIFCFSSTGWTYLKYIKNIIRLKFGTQREEFQFFKELIIIASIKKLFDMKKCNCMFIWYLYSYIELIKVEVIFLYVEDWTTIIV